MTLKKTDRQVVDEQIAELRTQELSDTMFVSRDGLEIFPDNRSPLYWANLCATEDIVVNQGGTWSGKSYSILQVLFTIAIIRPNYVITVATNTVVKLKEDALRIAKEIVKDSAAIKSQLLAGHAGYNATDRTYNFRNGSLIEFKSFTSDEEAKGGKRHILYINEATRIPFMIFFEAQLRTSVRTFIDYNPTAQFWAHDKVINNKAEYPSVKVIRSWHEHNLYLTQKQRDRIERIQDPDLWKVYARGLTGKMKGTVYTGWEEVEEFPWRNDVVWFIDFGYSEKESADPSAGGRLAIAPDETPYDYVADEIFYSRGMAVKEMAQLMKEAGYRSGQLCYCDHSPENIRDLRLHGIAAVPAIKGPGSVLSGILYLKPKKIGYTKRSKNIKLELKNYRFLEVEGIVTNTPVDEWNHILDGIRYAAHGNYLRTGKG